MGVVRLTTVMLTLVRLLRAVRAQLVADGEVDFLINADAGKAIKVRTGGTLLCALADQRIFIPSACGGKGSCGVCKVDVLEGGGAMLPTETAHITRREARQGCRLSCQVKVKQDLKVQVPAEVFDVRQWKCKVRSNRNVATFIKEFVIELPEGESVPFRAGGYIQIECPPHTAHYKDFDIDEEYRPDWDKFRLWNLTYTCAEPITRAYSMANHPLENGIIMLNVRVATPPPRAASSRSTSSRMRPRTTSEPRFATLAFASKRFLLRTATS